MSDDGVVPGEGIPATIADSELAMSEFGVVTEARTLRIRRTLPGPIERVWAYLRESEKRGRWLASGPMELRVGGRVELTYRNSDLSAHAEPAPDKYRKYAEYPGGCASRCRLSPWSHDRAGGNASARAGRPRPAVSARR
jgi:hypothetical protein